MWWPHLSERGVMFGDDYQMWMTGVAAHDRRARTRFR
jgi:hypothetical protein